MSELFIRTAQKSDAAAILEIYQPYVSQSTVTFETVTPSLAEIEHRILHTLTNYPYLVGEIDGQIIGYAYARRFRERQAYASTAEMSLYLDRTIRGKGYGQLLLSALENALQDRGISNLISIVEASNYGSLKFHEKNGFIRSGFLARVGYKFDQWLDIHILSKALTSDQPIISFQDFTPSKDTITKMTD
ncbi:N-acetyltransferase family protein [Ignavigranum ruoffiae]|uniref:Phosphinothricin acetyltransferase n=1 Tax=Ignavigranum ruoffiae TaxID=89093 RepID=A0A1H8ZFV2_9LACT|nr:GNAT family N-acetyltransferase [Ignavigranum ruoffiae]SEP63107.1 phosphinothricin acetyltransferase [Ignavigranum ruoffiae]